MEILLVIILFVLLIGIYDLQRKANAATALQTEEIKKLHDSIRDYMKNDNKS